MIHEITATCDCNINGEEETVTKLFSNWYHEGKLIQTAEKVAEDYFYGYFDKSYFKITKNKQIW